MYFFHNIHKHIRITNIHIVYPLLFANGIFVGIKWLLTSYYNKLLRTTYSSKPKKITDPSYEYYQKVKQRYAKSFEESNNNINTNIDEVFYSITKFQDIMKLESNYLERQWKTRILIETTPRGNIIMFYDTYKQGFAYYCDSNCIPYNILNAVAMKYVLTFYCRDFFVDNRISQYLPLSADCIHYDSPLIDIHFTDKKPTKKNSIISTNSFIKTKNYRPSSDQRYIQSIGNLIESRQRKSMWELLIIAANNITKKTINASRRLFENIYISTKNNKTVLIADVEIVKPEKEYNYNRFIQLGKISNFRFLQSPATIHCLNGFESVHYNNLLAETSLQKQVLNYKDFKSSRVME